jgi:hypothetical protein
MRTLRNVFVLALAVLAGGAVAWSYAQEGAEDGDRQRIKVFRLTKHDPQEARAALRKLMGEPVVEAPARPAAPAPAAAPGGLQVGAGAPFGQLGALGALGALGQLGAVGQVGVFGGQVGISSGPRAVIDRRTKALVVRGTKDEVDTAAELVAALNAPAGKAPAAKSLRSFRLQHADARDLEKLIRDLDPSWEVRVAAVGRVLFVLTRDLDPASVKELADLVKALDVPSD